jgi:hypothetical protein
MRVKIRLIKTMQPPRSALGVERRAVLWEECDLGQTVRDAGVNEPVRRFRVLAMRATTCQSCSFINRSVAVGVPRRQPMLGLNGSLRQDSAEAAA